MPASDLLARIEQLAGPDVAARIREEFAGSTIVITKPLRVVVELDLNPRVRATEAVAGLAAALGVLRDCGGAELRTLHVEDRGLGGGYIDLLERRPELNGIPVKPMSLRPAR